jgi:cell volume regulation protein A
VQGSTVRWLARRLRLHARERPAPPAVLEVLSNLALEADIVSFHLDPAVAVAGIQVGDVPLPEGAAIVLVVRGRALLPPGPDLVLLAGDHVYVICRDEHRPDLQLLFGRMEEE